MICANLLSSGELCASFLTLGESVDSQQRVNHENTRDKYEKRSNKN